MTKIKRFVLNDFQENGYILYDDSLEAVIIDGAANRDFEEEFIIDFIKDNNLSVKYIINTHGHLDHICGNSFLKTCFNVPILMNYNDNALVDSALNQASMYGFNMNQPPKSDQNIKEGDIISFGNSELKVIETPGHSLGSICLYCEKSDFLISGDTLFMQGIGRTDLPGGSYSEIIKNIKTKLLSLPKDTQVYPGHGPATTIGNEIKNNPFLV